MSGAHEWIRQWMTVYQDHHGYYVLPLVGLGLVGLRYLLSREDFTRRARPSLVRTARATLVGALVATALFSVLVYANFFNYHYGGYLNSYEFFHYYLGSKYSEEVGYFDMYGATLVADGETGRIYWPEDGEITDLRSNLHVPVEQLLRDEPRYRSLFSPERWREWVADVFYFKNRMGSRAWNRILHDRGYNATPAWTMIVGGGLSRRIPTSNETGMTALALLDVLLLAAAVACVAWAFGMWPALLMIVLLASSYLMAHVHMKGAFLRTDFVVCLIAAVCLLKKKRHALAGALVGYSTMSRLFPAAFLFGPLAKLAWESRRRGVRIDPRHVRFFGGFALVVVVLVIASTIYSGGIAVWSDFATKISLHRGDYHQWNVGLPSVVVAEFVGDQALLPDGAVKDHALTIRLIQLAGLLLCFFAVRGLDDHRALAFGFVPTFFLVAPTYYYFIVLLVPFLFLAERMTRAPAALGVAYLFLFGLMGHWLYQRWEQYFTTYYWNSVLALILALYMLALAFLETGRKESSPTATTAAP